MVTFGAALLVFTRLDLRSFWLDEAYTASTIDRSFADLVALTWRDEGYQILHQLVLWPVGQLSLAETWLRLPSAMAYVVTIPFLAVIGRRHFDATVGLIAASVYALNGFAIVLAQEARSYPFVALAALLSFDGFLRARNGESTWRWVGWATIAVWFHGFAIFAVAAPVLTLVAGVFRDPFQRRRWVPPLVAFGALVAIPLWLPWSHTDVSNDYAFLADLSIATVRDVVFTLFGRSGVAVIVVAGAVAAGVVAACRRRDVAVTAATAMAVFPALALCLLSLIDPVLLDRYLAASLPAIALLAAYGTVRATPNSLAPLLCAALLIGSTFGAARAVSRPELEDWREVVHTLAIEAEAGDALLVSVDEELVALEYYRPRFTGLETIDLAWPDAQWGSFATGDQGPTPLDDATAVAAVTGDPGPARIWIVDAKAATGRVDQIVETIVQSSDGYGRLAEYRFDGIRVVLLGRLVAAG